MAFIGARPSGWLTDEPAQQAADILDWAERAETLGFDVLFVGDRLLSAAATAGGDGVYEASMLDPFVLLSAIAARTRRIRLATLVAVVPFRHPASFAKLSASLDVISRGRFVLGAGSGWSAPELTLFDVDRHTRGPRLEAALRLVRSMWSGAPTAGDGRFWEFEPVRVTPGPVQRPGPPIWLASFAPEDSMTWDGSLTKGQRAVLRRIGRIADGWVPLTYSASAKRQLHPDQLAQGWEVIAESAAEAGRDPNAIQIIYPHWIAIARDEQERRATRDVLARYFTGDWDEALATYPIGTAEQVAAHIAEHTRGLPRIDGYLFTPISDDPRQLELIATELRPLLR